MKVDQYHPEDEIKELCGKEEISEKDRKHNRKAHVEACKEQLLDQAAKHHDILSSALRVAVYIVGVVGVTISKADFGSSDVVVQFFLLYLTTISMVGLVSLVAIFRTQGWSPGPEILETAETRHTLSQEEYDEEMAYAYTEASARNWRVVYKRTPYQDHLVSAAWALTVIATGMGIYENYFQEHTTQEPTVFYGAQTGLDQPVYLQADCDLQINWPEGVSGPD